MRTAFLLLVLANLAFFAWSRYVAPLDASADPLPLSRQIEPEKLKIIAPADLPPPVAQKVAAAPPAAAQPAAAPKCMEWGSFTLADAPRAEKALAPLALGARLAQRHTEELAGWWVFIPPQASRQAAQKKAAELKALGVDDYFIVQEDSEHRWALSLGVFRSEEAARARLGTLRTQGVRSAQVARRETVVPKVWLQVKSVDPALEARLKDIALQIEGSELKSCP
jgi:hypothetical protein